MSSPETGTRLFQKPKNTLEEASQESGVRSPNSLATVVVTTQFLSGLPRTKRKANHALTGTALLPVI
jgi:hypothetical protein